MTGYYHSPQGDTYRVMKGKNGFTIGKMKKFGNIIFDPIIEEELKLKIEKGELTLKTK